MQHLRRSIMRKIGGFAALCAMLLLSLAPAASQTLEHARIESLLASVCATNAQAPQHPQHGVADHLRACDYCDLIAHAPTPPSPLDTAGFLFSPREVFAAPLRADAPRRAWLAFAQPRAPPAVA
ncbi:hypothetical protein BSFA1_12360 [Burkholderia sp. SFA1]|nr:hypothetical protein BSFA1_12360 [Burkholderia sp. SFA1]